MSITKTSIAKYVFLPQIWPRLRELFVQGFHFVPYFIALVYQTVRILPAHHPYLNINNVGQYGIRDVVAQAARNIRWNFKNIDQIIVFIVILSGLAMTFLQFALLGLAVFAPSVFAATMPTGFKGFFVTPNPTHDLAHMMLDMVFGIPNFFRSCVDLSVGVTCQDLRGNPIENQDGEWILQSLGFPFPIHEGLHALFNVFSLGLLVVAVFITIYFITTIVMETATTGTAFGKRFNRVWAPIRIVVAFGLLIPINNGLNTAQYLVLYSAKFGSALATNGWNIFYSEISNSGGLANGNKASLISTPGTPEVGELLKFMFTVGTCKQLYDKVYPNPQRPEIEMYLVGDSIGALAPARAVGNYMDYNEMIDFINGDHQAIIRFGIEGEAYSKERGKVGPVCGELIMPVTDPRHFSGTDPLEKPEFGTATMQKYYWDLLQELWLEFGVLNSTETGHYAYCKTQNKAEECPRKPYPPPTPEYRTGRRDMYEQDLKDAVDNAATAQERSERWKIGQPVMDKGWGTSGLWYNRIAEINGALTTAVYAIPMPSKYPQVMENVKELKRQQDEDIAAGEWYNPVKSSGQAVTGLQASDKPKADSMWKAYNFWQEDGAADTTHTSATGNILFDAVNHLFGTSGLYDIRGKNANVHPLAQMVGMGRSLTEAAMRNFGYATGSALLGAAIPPAAGLASVAIDLLLTISTITITVGFVLYYIIPFLPFIYFFFALAGWVKGIFEAMVGMPLWALAHIRIDGEGLPGKAAANGYYLLLEIFLRPILIVFGLVASIQIYSALVQLLNQSWDIVVINTTGGNSDDPNVIEYIRNPIDQFFFTAIYAVIAYLLGTSSFKMIDQIPKQILRWMGQDNVASFGDTQEDPTDRLIQSSGLGVQQVTSALTGSGGGSGVKGALSGIANSTSGGAKD